jgi:hypothetical protein
MAMSLYQIQATEMRENIAGEERDSDYKPMGG